jgi:hypothetical protein
MSNPLRILQTLNRRLCEVAELTIFGRSAIALGFVNAPGQFHSTLDVDGILPIAWLQSQDAHEDFWRAVEETNRELEPDGLYVTHLFRELDVIVRPDWVGQRVALNLQFDKLRVFRPATIDLILTKMARADDDDLQDIRFLFEQERITKDEIQKAFSEARIPAVPEVKQLFERAAPKVLALVS